MPVTLRPATDHDLDTVLALGVAEEVAWFGEAEVSADEVGEWIDNEGGLLEGVVAVGEDGCVAGFASPGVHEAVLLADVARTDVVVDELLPWLRSRREALELTTFAGDAARVDAFARHGLEHVRSLFSLLRPDGAGALPEPAFPEGVDVAPYRLGDDDEAAHRLVYVDAEWTAVSGHVVRDLDTWRKGERRNRMFLARREGRPVGWVSGRLLDNGRGFVGTLAVAATERRRGLGRALLLHGLADLQRAGARGLSLGVQAANDTALGLYRSVGLEVEREWRTYASR